jgi:peptidoglycan/LPS O-acetylase OafA/YrhL
MQKLTYRPALDGIRAIAILAVCTFHIDKNWLSGGFIGVDIFFVLSGYLITSIIKNDILNKSFSFSRFYQRRIARIFPVYFLVTIVTLVAAKYIYTIQDFASTGAVTVAATLSLANIKYMFQGGYFEISPDAQPLMHYWSLSVEEQFYLIFPLLLFYIYKITKTKNITIFKVFIILCFSSLALCIYLTKTNPTWAFYLLPTRAWELLSGCSLAIYMSTQYHNKRTGNNFQQIIGLGLILSSLIFIHEGLDFPGYIAILPVVGTILIIAGKGDGGFIEKLLSFPPVAYIGMISYSLYLWHWPIFSFVDYHFYEELEYFRTSSKIILTLSISVISYSYIEKPIRRYLNSPKRKAISFTVFPIIILSLTIFGYEIRSNYHIDANASSIKDGGILVDGDINKPSIVLMGDSNAAMYGVSIVNLASELNIKANIIAVDAGDMLPSSRLWKDSIVFLEKANPDLVVYINSWSGKLNGNEIKLNEAIKEIKKHSKLIILITQPPILPKYASREEIRNYGIKTIFEEQETKELRKKTNQYIMDLQESNVMVLDGNPLFTNENGSILFTNKNGNQLYQDSGHLSGAGANLVLNNLLRPELEKYIHASKSSNKANTLGHQKATLVPRSAF